MDARSECEALAAVAKEDVARASLESAGTSLMRA
jgi:hypothetical protein